MSVNNYVMESHRHDSVWACTAKRASPVRRVGGSCGGQRPADAGDEFGVGGRSTSSRHRA
jgi:hypothetical protein